MFQLNQDILQEVNHSKVAMPWSLSITKNLSSIKSTCMTDRLANQSCFKIFAFIAILATSILTSYLCFQKYIYRVRSVLVNAGYYGGIKLNIKRIKSNTDEYIVISNIDLKKVKKIADQHQYTLYDYSSEQSACPKPYISEYSDQDDLRFIGIEWVGTFNTNHVRVEIVGIKRPNDPKTQMYPSGLIPLNSLVLQHLIHSIENDQAENFEQVGKPHDFNEQDLPFLKHLLNSC